MVLVIVVRGYDIVIYLFFTSRVSVFFTVFILKVIIRLGTDLMIITKYEILQKSTLKLKAFPY